MAQIHNELRRSHQLLKAYRNALGVQDPDAGVERFSETLQPTFDIWSRDEWAFLRNEDLWSIFGLVAAVAAEFSFVGIRNAAGSGRLVTIDTINANSATATQYELTVDAVNAVDVDLTDTVNIRDLRRRRTAGAFVLSVPQILEGAGAVVQGVELARARHPANAETNSFPRVILPPGFEARLYTRTLNQAAEISFVGRVRNLLLSEA